jgi:hypothetical protein
MSPPRRPAVSISRGAPRRRGRLIVVGLLIALSGFFLLLVFVSWFKSPRPTPIVPRTTASTPIDAPKVSPPAIESTPWSRYLDNLIARGGLEAVASEYRAAVNAVDSAMTEAGAARDALKFEAEARGGVDLALGDAPPRTPTPQDSIKSEASQGRSILSRASGVRSDAREFDLSGKPGFWRVRRIGFDRWELVPKVDETEAAADPESFRSAAERLAASYRMLAAAYGRVKTELNAGRIDPDGLVPVLELLSAVTATEEGERRP